MQYRQVLLGASLASLAAAAPTATTKVPTLVQRDPNAVVTGTAAVTSINDSDGNASATSGRLSLSGDGSAAAGWPTQSQWISFDAMWANNQGSISVSCPPGIPQNSADETANLRAAIESVAQASGVDHRVILAVVMQESHGCVRVPATANAVTNPGLMQDYQGTHSCNNAGALTNPCPADEITGMIQDGARGTDSGDGLASYINKAQGQGATDAQVFYLAARFYNSGPNSCPPGCDLSGSSSAATVTYSADIASRLLGWVN